MQKQDSNSPLQPESLRQRLNGWFLGISLEGESVLRGVLMILLISLFALLQTTLMTRFRPFGATPDLMLPLVVGIAMTAREKWGAVSGIIAAFVIESLGGATLTILPLFYMPVGYICGILSIHYFRDGFAVRSLYTVVTGILRAVVTLILIFSTTPNTSLPDAFSVAVIPEFFATLLFAPLPHCASLLFRLIK
ncbi:MAG: hypothetical protein E7658_04035 [Ruminococcaceae bacterium]|nr:hypothetical protein [Oscillospiraceae bacterium]